MCDPSNLCYHVSLSTPTELGSIFIVQAHWLIIRTG
ncbi:hypothetical protein ACVI1K_007680 [Bradyrhizobium sp. USDA 4508]|nr:hypothetical protein [Bradyrhizobium sp. USDA 4541]